MKTDIIRQKLHNYLEAADDKKIKALYTIIEEDVEQYEVEYTEELKAELDRRRKNYQSGKSKAISAEKVQQRMVAILKNKK